MNQTVVDEIAKQLNRVNDLVEVKRIVEERQIKHVNMKNFSADYLNDEFRKITSARERDYPTYRSEYRVVKTLIRLRNEIMYHLRTSTMFSVNVDNILMEFIDLSKYLLDTLKRVGGIFEQENNISRFAEEFDNTWSVNLSKHVNDHIREC